MNRFKVLPEDEQLALRLHNYIVAQSKVITTLSVEATKFIQSGEYDAAQQVHLSIKYAQTEMNRAYRDLAELRQRRIEQLNQHTSACITININQFRGGRIG